MATWSTDPADFEGFKYIPERGYYERTLPDGRHQRTTIPRLGDGIEVAPRAIYTEGIDFHE
jgi:hypothetical protein